MSTLNDLDTGEAKIQDKDTVGSSFEVLDTNIYPFFVSEAFLEKAASGALGVHLTLTEKADGTGKILEKTLWIRSGDDKGNKSYYLDRDKVQQPLPGFVTADTLCYILTGKRLKEMKTTSMIAKVYDADEKKRVNTKVDMLKTLLKQPVYAAVEKQIVDKQIKNDAGKYVNSGQTREENEILKFFRAKDKKSATEIEADNAEPAAFYHTWLKSKKDKTRDRSSNKGKAAPAGAAAAAGVTAMFDEEDA